MNFEQALDAYANALVVSITEGGIRQSAEVLDRKVLAAKTQLLKLHRAALRGETAALRQVARIRKVLG